MTDESRPAPDWKNSDHWNEFQWEQALKYSDQLATRFFGLLQRYGDLPDAEEFIAAKLGDKAFTEIDEADPYHFEAPEDWREGPDDLDDDDGEDDEDGDRPGGGRGGDDDDDDDDPDSRGKPGDSLFYETSPVFDRARQLSLGWCNIFSSVLRQEDRLWGLKILFGFGRVLSYLSLSIGDGTYERLPASLAFGKRAAAQINAILGEIDQMSRETRRYASTLKRIREMLLELHDLTVGYLGDLRKRERDDEPPF